MAPATAIVFLGLLFVFAATTPLGLLLLQIFEKFRGSRFGLSSLERVLLAPYVAVALLFVVAMIPAPVYGLPLVAGLLALGVAGQSVLWVRQRAAGLRAAIRWLTSVPGLAILLGTIGLVILEVYATGSNAFPNAYDGSFQSTYVWLLVRNHTAPWTLDPIAAFGVAYPLGAAVWMSLPVLLLGWPVLAAPVALPPFFLGLSGAGAFCWGNRLGGLGTERGTVWGLVFAGFYGLIASWPRLFIGGSYDFAFALPLLLLTLGWVQPFVESGAKGWKNVLAFGALLGVGTSLSLAIGEAIVLLLIASIVVYHGGGQRLTVGQWGARVAAILGLGAAFVSRSILALVEWYRYPEHVLGAVGNPPYATVPGLPAPTPGTFFGNLNPLVPFKWKLSPIPLLSVELTVLLVVGLVLLVAWRALPHLGLREVLPQPLVIPVVMGTVVMFLWTLFLIAASGSAFLAPVFDSLASLYESSFLLFVFYQTIALVPLIALVEVMRQGYWNRSRPRADPPSESRIQPAFRLPDGPRSVVSRPVMVEAGVLLVLPFVIGAIATPTLVPSFLSTHLDEYSNVTSSDVDALQWAAGHLPSCSTVLVAPGSAALFLPLYVTVHVDFPMMPLSANLSYSFIVANLTTGIYTPQNRLGLLELGITEVFVTGQTSVSYAPFQAAPLANSSDFSTFYHQGDAYVFGFDPVLLSSGCVPT